MIISIIANSTKLFTPKMYNICLKKRRKNVELLCLKVYHHEIIEAHDYIILYRYISVESNFLEQFTFFTWKLYFCCSVCQNIDRNINIEFYLYFRIISTLIVSIARPVGGQLKNILNWTIEINRLIL